MAQTQKRRIEQSLDPAGHLGRPYSRVIIPEQDGTFRAEILEFPGCIATGDTEIEALASLKDVALSWLEVTLAKGQVIPEPIEKMEFSGKLVLRLPKSLHKKASRAAERDGISLNQFIVSSLAQQVGSRSVATSPKLAPQIDVMPQIFIGSHEDLLEAALQTPTGSVQTANFIRYQTGPNLRSAHA